MQLFGTKGQKFLYCPGTKRQRNKLKILPRDGTGRDFLQAVPSRDVPGHNHFQFCTFCTVLERPFSVLERPFPVLERPFPVFWGKVILSRDVPGQKNLSWDFCSYPCPGTKGQQDKEIFLSRDNRTSRPGLSLGNPNMYLH